jgi:hypothetical protein
MLARLVKRPMLKRCVREGKLSNLGPSGHSVSTVLISRQESDAKVLQGVQALHS